MECYFSNCIKGQHTKIKVTGLKFSGVKIHIRTCFLYCMSLVCMNFRLLNYYFIFYLHWNQFLNTSLSTINLKFWIFHLDVLPARGNFSLESVCAYIHLECTEGLLENNTTEFQGGFLWERSGKSSMKHFAHRLIYTNICTVWGNMGVIWVLLE